MHISLSPQKMHGTSKLPQNSAKGIKHGWLRKKWQTNLKIVSMFDKTTISTRKYEVKKPTMHQGSKLCRVWVFVRVALWSLVLVRVGAIVMFQVFFMLECGCVGLTYCYRFSTDFLLKPDTLFL
jgi:hypothetical protein